jgi:hypothetical protein
MSTPPDGPAPNPEPNPPEQPSPQPQERHEGVRPDGGEVPRPGSAGGEFSYEPTGGAPLDQRPLTDLPGIFLIILGVLSILASLFMGFRAVQVGMTSEQEFQQQLDASRELNEKVFGKASAQGMPDAATMKNLTIGMTAGGGVLGLIASAIMVLGGVRMRQYRSYALSMTASVAAMLPCITCTGCCGAGQGIGLWAMIVLLKPEVKALFKYTAQAPGGGAPI